MIEGKCPHCYNNNEHKHYYYYYNYYDYYYYYYYHYYCHHPPPPPLPTLLPAELLELCGRTRRRAGAKLHCQTVVFADVWVMVLRGRRARASARKFVNPL
jgi:hypothetical protein